MSYASLKSFFVSLRKPKYFLFIILPISIIIGRFLPSLSEPLNDVGLTLIQLISFPAIPLVLSAVVISINSIFSSSDQSRSESYKFARTLLITIIIFVFAFSFLAVMLSLYSKPGILSPEGKLSIGRFMLDVTDINVTVSESAISENVPSPNFWKSLVPTNILTDASKGQTLKVITGSILGGLGLAALPKETSRPIVSFLSSLNSLSVKILDELLIISPLILICLIAGAMSKISTELIVALLNLAICILLASVASLGIAKLVLRKFTTSAERSNFTSNPADEVFLLALTTGSSIACYPTIIKSLKEIGRSPSESEAATSLSLLISRLGNVVYNVIVIIFALNLYEVNLSPIVLVQILVFGVFTGIASAGLNGVAVLPTIGFALAYFAVPLPPILILLIAVDPILTLARSSITGVLSLAISTVSTRGS
jgi:Na+/H+-dicarboxylate symporter